MKMDLKAYRENKRQREESERKRLESLRNPCPKCLRPENTCFCKKVVPFSTNTRFVILMHPKEAYRERVGTGRLSHICLSNSEIIIDSEFEDNKRLEEILSDESFAPFVLYPGRNAVNLTNGDFPAIPDKRNLLVIVIDSTWTTAKRIMYRSKKLKTLPRICFIPSGKSEFVIKQQPQEACLSTVEAIYQFLESCEKSGLEKETGKKENMITIFRDMVDYQMKCASDPDKPGYRRRKYKKPSERKPSLRWQKRKLFD